MYDIYMRYIYKFVVSTENLAFVQSVNLVGFYPKLEMLVLLSLDRFTSRKVFRINDRVSANCLN